MATNMMMEQMQTVSNVYRQLIPSEHGESLEDQIFPWSVSGLKQDMQTPLPAHEGDPRTMYNVMQMMCVEMQHWADYHAYAKMTSDERFKSLLGSLARAEHVHHLKLMSLLPKPHSPSESVLEMETALLTGYNMAIKNETNSVVRSAFSHIFRDHLQHAEFAADRVRDEGCPVDKITGGADLSGGRPLDQQFMKPGDTIWNGRFDGCYSKDTVDVRTLVNVDMLLAGELAAWSGYMCAMENTDDQSLRLNLGAFQSIEDQHMGILGSIKDPRETLLERSLVHEQVEMHNYRMMMEHETNPQAKKVFEDLYREDLEQARLLGQMVM